MEPGVSSQGGREFEAVFGPVLDQIVGLLEAETGVLWVWEETAAVFIPILCRGRGGWADPWSPSHPGGISQGDLDVCRHPLLFDDLPPDFPVPAGEQKIRSFASVPLTVGGKGTGFLALYSRRRGHFAPRDLRFLQMVGQLIGITIEQMNSVDDRKGWEQQVHSEKLAALGTLAAGVAHNINNVLAAIVARADLLLRQVQDGDLKRWLNSIQQSALDGASTVRRLQDFARVETPESVVPVDVNRVVTDVLQFTQARWKDEAQLSGIRIEVVTELTDVPLVTANPAELREVFTNVIFNAIDAMPNGGRLTVQTRAYRRRDRGPSVEVVLGDTGLGMSEEVRQKIFDPFFTTKGVKGTGLGLSTSYGIVARHGGSISVESEVGQGSRFSIAFPIPAKLPRSREGVLTPTGHLTGRILVIDDEPHLVEVVTNLLKLEGHIAVGAGCGIDGVEMFRAEPFDVLITDLGMADLTGLEVARKVRALDPEVKVILCTGWNVAVSRVEQQAAGVDRLLEKPFRLDKLLHQVHELLRDVPHLQSRGRG